MSARVDRGLAVVMATAAILGASAARGAERYWVGSGNWSATANWSATSGGAGNAGVPGSGDTAIFDGLGTGNATVDAAFGGTVGAVDIRSGYTGTNTQNRNLTVEGGFALGAGTWQFTAGTAADLIVSGSMVVDDATIQCQRTSTSVEGTGRHIAVGGNLTIGGGGVIDGLGMGFDAGGGPGGTGGRGGGAHGGQGGDSAWGTSGRTTYGSITNPVSLGSGRVTHGTSKGGGAVRFTVGGSVIHNGVINCNGEGIGTGAAGAGGSIWIQAADFAGGGTISVDGGTAPADQGNGGGGRIALIATNSAGFGNLVLYARGGTANRYGAAGTIYLQDTNAGRLIIDNAGNTPAAHSLANGIPTTRVPAANTYAFDAIVITNSARFEIVSGAVLDLTAGRTLSGDADKTPYLVMSGGTIKTGGGLTLTNLWISQRGLTAWTVDGPLTVAGGARITHYPNGGISIDHRLDVQVNGAFVVQEGGRIDVTGMGHPFRTGLGTDWHSRGGAAHGGQGSKSQWDDYGGRTTYGSITNPVTLGSGGSSTPGSGGGSVLLTVAGPITNNGLIAADGTAGNQSGGSGGSVRVIAADLAGSGMIRADGGTAWNGNQGNGGGGRVAVYVTNATDLGSATVPTSIRALGGTNASFAAAGTVYLRHAGHLHGTLIIDNGGNNAYDTVTHPTRTVISTQVTDTTVGDVIIRNQGEFGLLDNQSLTVMGSWSNRNVFVAGDGSIVTLAGPNTATVYGDSAFHDLICTNAGKTVRFEAGGTTVIKAGGTLTLQGEAEANWLELVSTAPGTQWHLTLQAGSYQEVRYVAVKDSNAGAGDEVLAPTGRNDGNNLNWNFVGGQLVTWTGNADSDWGNADNWNPVKLPSMLDAVMIPDTSGGSGRYPVLDASRVIGGLTNAAGSSLSLNGYALRVSGDARVGGMIMASGNETIRFGGDVDMTGGGMVEATSTVVLDGDGAQSVIADGEHLWNIRVENTAGEVHFVDGFTAHELSATNPAVALRFDGDFTLHDLRCTGPGTALVFADGIRVTVTNLLLRGASGSPVELRSSDGGAWNLAVGGWGLVRHVDASDSDASGGRTVYAAESVDGGSNDNWNFGAWLVWNGAVSDDFATDGNWTSAQAPGDADRVLIDGGYTYAPRLSGATTVDRLVVGIGGEASALTLDAALVVDADVMVGPAGMLTHSANASTDQYRLDLTVGGDLFVSAGGQVNVAGKGFAKGYGSGTGSGNTGASHGGMGVAWSTEGTPGPTYGSIREPVTLGSGSGTQGNSPGGGAIRLRVGGCTLLDGVIRADGTIVNNNASSGGSVYLTTGSIRGAGTITARGGVTTHTPGGGGRVAVVVTNAVASFAEFDGSVTALSGGIGFSGSRPSGAGTVYVREPGQALDEGTLIVVNSGTTAGETRIGSLVTGTAVGDVNIRDAGHLALHDDQTLDVHGSWTNAASFTARTGSTVAFAGTASATVWGDNTWQNLTIATPGKTVSFEAGKTQTVNGTPTVDSGVTLLSTAPGTQWRLTVPGTLIVDEQPVGRVSAQDSDASAGKTIVPSSGTDLGNNLNWIFPPAGSLFLLR